MWYKVYTEYCKVLYAFVFFAYVCMCVLLIWVSARLASLMWPGSVGPGNCAHFILAACEEPVHHYKV